MTRFVLNSAVITSPGDYSYSLLRYADAKRWLERGPFESAVTFDVTAQVLRAVTGIDVPVRRRAVRMQRGDEALIARVKMSVNKAGSLSVDELTRQMEIGLLRRVA